MLSVGERRATLVHGIAQLTANRLELGFPPRRAEAIRHGVDRGGGEALGLRDQDYAVLGWGRHRLDHLSGAGHQAGPRLKLRGDVGADLSRDRPESLDF